MRITNRPTTTSPTNTIQLIAVGLAVIFGGILLATFAPAILPTAGSAESREVDNLFRFMLAIGGAIFLLVQGLLVYSVIKFRTTLDDRRDGPPIQGNSTLELIWTVIPAIIVFVLTIYSYQVWTSTHSVKPNEQFVNVTGARFAWTFNYPVTAESIPADLDVSTVPEDIRANLDSNELSFNSTQLHTWVNQPVAVRMNTQDVNHAFWIPGMRIKQDLLTGRETEVRFTPVEPGVYRIVCAELCGSGHGNMAGEVSPTGELLGAWLIVHADYDTYLREFYVPNTQQVLFPPEDPVQLGRQVLASGKYPCATCHALDDLNWQGNIGPNLNNIGARAETRVPGQTADEYLHNSIRHPGDYLVPGYANLMPQFNPSPDQPNYMPDTDLDAIVAYLLTQREGD
jgi:cytochrome c oxidase subunit II